MDSAVESPAKSPATLTENKKDSVHLCSKSLIFKGKFGRGDRIRTYDPLVPNQMRYQTALRPDSLLFYPLFQLYPRNVASNHLFRHSKASSKQ